MATIVDGMNVIGANPDGWWRDRPRARLALTASVVSWSVGNPDAHPVTVVFDGRPTGRESEGRSGDVEVRYAPGGPNAADDVIVELVGLAADPAAVLVVTSDAALVDRVRRAGAAVEGAKAFRARLGLDDRG
jgi:predicted RNA-binding protein with PIN domain